MERTLEAVSTAQTGTNSALETGTTAQSLEAGTTQRLQIPPAHKTHVKVMSMGT